MKTVTVADFAKSVNISVDKLMLQLADAGVEADSPETEITGEQKTQLLMFLRKSHGVNEETTDAKPRRVTLRRNVTSELRQSSGPKTRSSISTPGADKVTVTVRKKRTFVKREEPTAPEEVAPEVSPEAVESEIVAQQPVAEVGEVPVAVTEPAAVVEAVEPASNETPKVKAEDNPVAAEKVPAVEVVQQESAAKPEAAAPKKTAPVEAKKAAPAAPADKDAGRNSRKKGKQPVRGKGKRGNVLGGLASKRRRVKSHRKSSESTEHAFEMPTSALVRQIEVGETITVVELASRLAVKAGEVIKVLMKMGQMVTINQVIDQDMAILLAEEMGHTATPADSDNPEGDLTVGAGEEVPRAPVVTVMGHVDHGKTTLLDYIRNSRVAAGESGGITQHIGAYHVETDNGHVTFLDTPGHAAFSAMRARGAELTDIIVLVVAADDGVMPQTLEAIKHATSTGVPIVVAVNKMDKPEADANRVKQELSSHGVAPDDWGGEAQFIELSAKTGEGVDQLLEALTIQAELLELKAPVDGPAQGVVIESKLDRGRGAVATVLIQQGTLRPGDVILAGTEYGKARVLTSDSGQRLSEVGPSLPIEIVGLSGAPGVGDDFNAVIDERKAREIADFRRGQARDKALASKVVAGADEDIFSQLKANEISTLNLIIKADVRGSAEAIVSSLEELPNDEVAVKIIQHGVGAINETDVNLAISSSSLIIGFNVRADATARKLIQDSGVDLHYHSIIYEVIDQIRAALTGMLAPEFAQQIIGLAEVKEVFRSPKYGDIAGSMVTEGRVRREAPIRVLRDNVVVFEGELESLRRFKDDVNEVKSGTECGIGVKGYTSVQPGDQIECFERVQVERTL